MLATLMNLLKACWLSASAHTGSDVVGRQDGLLWYKDNGHHMNGEFSMAVVQANSLLEDQSQIESGPLSLLDSGPYGTFVGVYDGHGGPETSCYINDHLFQHLKRFVCEHQSMSAEVIQKAYQATEEGFLSLVTKQWPMKPQIAAVGSCCLVGVICSGMLYTANLGDSRVVLGKLVKATREILAVQLSAEHNAAVEAVRQELQSMHPEDKQIVVLKHNVWRVKGIIQISRSIGDVYLKKAEFNREPLNAKFRLRQPFKKPILSSEPSIHVHLLQPQDQFLIFASDGLWEHLSNQEAVNIVHNHPHNFFGNTFISNTQVLLILGVYPYTDPENSSKVIRAITWHRSPSVSSSHMSLLASSSNSTSWTESASELSDDYVGMASGSHSQTLGRLYAWEKKLYEEVKAGDYTWQAYQKKCLQLRNKEAKEAKSRSVDKTRASAKELYARIGVAFRAAQSISERIQKLRDEELQPQILELIQGLMQTWKVMLESHESQKKIMFEVNTFTSPTYGKFCNDSHRLATVTLEAELRSWRSCFIGYVAAQRAYVETLDRWLSKFLVSDVEYYSRSRSLFPSHKAGTPPVVVISHEWLTSLRRLPDQSVSTSMRSFIRTVRGLWIKQGEEQQQKRKVHRLAKELDHRVLALQKAENKVLESKLSEDRPDSDMRQRVEYLSGRKELLEMFRKKLEAEKAKHRECMRKTHEITINGFKIGLASIFESLMQFSKDSVNFYGDLLMHDEKGKVVNEEIAQKTICREDLGQG